MRYVLGIMLLLMPQAVQAENIEIDMLKQQGNERMLYSKPLVQVKVGDSVTWVAADKTHNVEFIKGGVPEGVEIFRSKFNVDAQYVFTTPGVYAYKCTAHYSMGMIGFVIVGDDLSNLAAVKGLKHPSLPRKRAKKILSEL